MNISGGEVGSEFVRVVIDFHPRHSSRFMPQSLFPPPSNMRHAERNGKYNPNLINSLHTYPISPTIFFITSLHY